MVKQVGVQQEVGWPRGGGWLRGGVVDERRCGSETGWNTGWVWYGNVIAVNDERGLVRQRVCGRYGNDIAVKRW